MKHIIAVASGKGGVGKSTVASNLAVSLANTNVSDREKPLKVALIDVDFYGPSIPTLMGGGEIQVNPQGKFLPALRYNVKYVSIAFFLKNPDDPIIWRGPMFGKAINQLFTDVDWGDVDICIVDMPPGTGDAQLSLSQMISLSGVLMVTTPQEVALSDVRRAINMFRKVNVPVLGIIENMAGFVTDQGEEINIFGKGGGEELSKNYDIALLGSIPIDLNIGKGGDLGEPIAIVDGAKSAEIFNALAEKVILAIDEQQQARSPLSVVN